MNIIKRDGTEVRMDKRKIINAIHKAMDETNACGETVQSYKNAINVANVVYEKCRKRKSAPTVEEVQDMVETGLMKYQEYDTAKRYIHYRYDRANIRNENTTDARILSIVECRNEDVKQENSNKNPNILSVQRDYIAGEVSKDITNRYLLPPEIVHAHKEGIIHFHDADYFVQHSSNCCLVNLEDMLQNGTVISGTKIEKPHSFSTACNITTQIIAQVASSQYGGQSISLTHLAPFVDISRQKIRRDVLAEAQALGVSSQSQEIEKIIESRVKEEINRGVQMLQYQTITLMTTNGQAPFITLFMYLNEARNEQEKHDLALIIEEVLKQRYQGVKNEKGVWITPAFPKLVYVLQPDNLKEGDPYYYLTKLAAKCTARRMVPDYVSEKQMLKLKIDSNGDGHCYPPMGCRSFLTPYVNDNGEPQYYGRFNQGVVTINLPDIALSAKGDMSSFWKIFDERAELCHRALQCRHERLTGTLSDVAPIMWQYGALARLKK